MIFHFNDKTENNNNQKLILKIKDTLNKEYTEVDYRRLEYVGPTVSRELIKAGALSILIEFYLF